jgi:alkylhydroperoxidase family enzyme
MTWIKTVSMDDDPLVAQAMLKQRALYPVEYSTPVPAVDRGAEASITASHSLIPDALFHAFATFGALLSPDLPLRRDQHEMIATMVSVTNRCHY